MRKKGIQIGTGNIIRSPETARIDLTRPSLIQIGNNVDFNMNFQILTHDWCSHVFRNCFHDFVNSSGKVKIGNNIYFGTNVIVLKGVTIGDNCIIGAGSIVTKDIPSNSVATGAPCKVICTLDQYYERRKAKGLEEAKEYVRSIRERFDREPLLSEMYEEFIYFTNKDNINNYSESIPIKKQIGENYKLWLDSHQSKYDSFESFLNDVN